MAGLILHEYAGSGNCYKIRLTAALLGLPIERREYDILKGETRTPEFLATINHNGRIPVLQDGDRLLAESNAACIYLAEGTRLVPADRFDRAQMLRWMFYEQNLHEPNIATLRLWLSYIGEAALSPSKRASIPDKRAAGEDALATMEGHLAGRRYFVGDALTLADIALYAYTHVAGEAGFDLARRPGLSAWLERVAAEPGWVVLRA